MLITDFSLSIRLARTAMAFIWWIVISVPLTSQEVVAEYRGEYSTQMMPTGWNYLWNSGGAIGDPANYSLLEADGAVWDTDSSNPGQPDPAPGYHLHLDDVGGHPGNGTPDRYAIAAYTVEFPGTYSIAQSFITLVNPTMGDGVAVLVHVNGDPEVFDQVVAPLGTIDFDVALGELKAGDTIYVAFGENGTHSFDGFVMDFAIERVTSSVPTSALQDLDIENAGWPRAFFFRFEWLSSHPTIPDYATWKSIFDRLGGVIMVAQKIELASLDPKALGYLQTFAVDAPEQLAVLHMNGVGADPSYFDDALSAGHWLYFPGTGVSQQIRPSHTQITVLDGSLFRETVGIGGAKQEEIVVARVDENGDLVWAEAEHMRVTGITGNVLTVERNIHGLAPSPMAFEAGETYVAPHAWNGPWGVATNNLLWLYNYSDFCPKDESGRNARSALVDYFTDLFSPGGDIEGFNGVQLDIAQWELPTLGGRIVDVDLDGQGDGGFDGSHNFYGEGMHNYIAELRGAFGPSKLILADGGQDDSQRATDYLNGIEAEGFCAWNDPFFKEWSSNMNRFRYWRTHRQQPYELSYINHKEATLASHPFHTTRMVLSVAQQLAVAVSSLVLPPPGWPTAFDIWDELQDGSNGTTNWLGTPRGPMLRLATNSTDMLGGAGVDVTTAFVQSWTSSDATVAKDGAALYVSPAGTTEPSSMTISFASTDITSGDLFFRFRIRADPLDGVDPDVPRKVHVTADGRQVSADTADDLYAFAGTGDPAEVTFYYRDAGPTTNLEIHIEVEGSGDFWISDFTLHSAVDALAREFESGVVLTNPSATSAYVFDLQALFPGRSFRRICGTSNQDQSTNDGLPVTGTTISVPPLDGLFLAKTADSSLDDGDFDGLPDEWEFEFSASLTTLSGGASDADADGETDTDEYQASTDPTDVLDLLEADYVLDGGQVYVVSWPAKLGKLYRVQYSTNGVNWDPVGSLYEGFGTEITARIPAVLLGGSGAYSFRAFPLSVESNFPPSCP